ncbi:TRAFAC clade GTPase domain-containing protein [Conyzicola sp.]|uniref:TRAFAC clade GTPase domain-containing protein n=1 Tax=Conyzicola sp. TaxID=1969404 RepID=UPI003989F14B
MAKTRKKEQHVAVFGESGSGKTVLVSSFYGAAREQQHGKDKLFSIVADKTSQGRFLHQTYLGMRGSAQLPIATSHDSESYSFSINVKDASNRKSEKNRPFDALRLVWHDYPGEWFEEDASGTEATRRVETFRNLLKSDVAFILVDGQRLLDNSGDEERYLKALLTNFANGLLLIKDDLLEDGRPFVQFPRIWIFALSKADLLPDVNVFDFRDLLVSKASNEIDQLEEVLAGFVQERQALSVGEDFVLLSSAKFEAGRIEVAQRIGLNLILPIAAMLPFERHVRWAKAMNGRGKVYKHLVDGAGAMAGALGGIGALANKLNNGNNKLVKSLGLVLTHFGGAIEEAAKLFGDRLLDANGDAVAKEEHLRATLTGFQMDLASGEDDQIFIRSDR